VSDKAHFAFLVGLGSSFIIQVLWDKWRSIRAGNPWWRPSFPRPAREGETVLGDANIVRCKEPLSKTLSAHAAQSRTMANHYRDSDEYLHGKNVGRAEVLAEWAQREKEQE
jgi:hypothetical protein